MKAETHRGKMNSEPPRKPNKNCKKCYGRGWVRFEGKIGPCECRYRLSDVEKRAERIVRAAKAEIYKRELRERKKRKTTVPVLRCSRRQNGDRR